MNLEQLFVCEKPSQARSIAEAISGGYEKKDGYYVGKDGIVYTYAIGHLVTCVSPDEINPEWGWKGDVTKLPFFMTHIPLKLIDDAGLKKQFHVVKKLMEEAEIIYIGGDPAREGEHIFRKIYKLSGVQKPLKRLWIKDMTVSGIKKAYANAKDGSEYEGLALAGRLREESDLLIGLNSTMLLTKLAKSRLLSLGRVQTPTLAMIVNRDLAIEAFSKEKHYTVGARAGKDILFTLVFPKDKEDLRISEKQALAILNHLGPRTDYEVESKLANEMPPKLFDLTELQKLMNEKHGWSADTTLKTTQSLYEKQLVTYPRTSSQFLASDEELPDVLRSHSAHPVVQNILNKRFTIEQSFINPEKVTDHEAIIITTKRPGNLQGNEKTLYDVIFLRFVCAFYPPAVKERIRASFKAGNYTFEAKETVIVELGWRELIGDKIEASKLKNLTLDDIQNYELIERETQPPKRYTESTLLGDMKNASKFIEDEAQRSMMKECEGIGTTATRAAIIELLIKRKYVDRKKKQLISTPLGRELIGMMPENFSLYSVKMTAYFETLLSEIQNSHMNDEEYYRKLSTLVTRIAGEIREHAKPIVVNIEKEVLCTCPKCGSAIQENSKGFGCTNYKSGCKVAVWKNGLSKLGKKTITKTEAKKLLDGQEVKVKLKSKDNKPYERNVKLNFEKGWVEMVGDRSPNTNQNI